jgi:hypothetical protein
MNKTEILETAQDLVTGDRNQSHGDAGEQFQLCADLWNAYLGLPVGTIKREDVGMMMDLSKKSRFKCGKFNPDDFVDMCGYSALTGELAAETQKHREERTIPPYIKHSPVSLNPNPGL